jgi:hypothetical protein
MFFTKGHGNPSGPPNAPLYTGVFKSRGDQEGNPGFPEILFSTQQGNGNTFGDLKQFGIGILLPIGDYRAAFPEVTGALN